LFHRIRVRYDTTDEIIGASWDLGEEVAYEAAGAGFRDGDRELTLTQSITDTSR
jgi:hypothetical protein